MKGENADTKKPAMRSAAKRLAFTALFAALCCVGTMFIVIPLPHGYFNAGDVFVLLAGWCMGPVFGGIAAGLHNNLAPAACTLCPEAGEVEAWLRERPGVLAAQVTGSGTCSFALCESPEAADDAAAEAVSRGWRAWSTKTLGSSPKVC